MISGQERARREAAYRSALASQAMEGLQPAPSVLLDMQRYTRGELTIQQALDNYRALLAKQYGTFTGETAAPSPPA